MLRKPSSILAQVNVQFPREYAYRVFWSLQQSDQHTRFFDTSFVNQADAVRMEESVRNRVNNSIACLGAENCIALAPLFLRAQEDALIQLSSQLVLVMCREGPVIPVLLLRHIPFPEDTPESSAQQETQRTAPAVVHIATSSTSQQIVQQENAPHEGATPLNKEQQLESEQSLRSTLQDEHKETTPGCTHQDPNDHAPLNLSTEDELRYAQMMTKTPISAICNLRNTTMPESLTREEQLQRCQQMKQSIESLYTQRAQHEQVLCNPHIRPTTQRVLKESLARKCTYIQQQLKHIAQERSKLIEQQQLNEVTRRVLLSGSDMDPSWQRDIDLESEHLQACIELLEAANPHMSA